MKKILKRIDLGNKELNFEFKNQYITIKSESYRTLEYIKERAIKRMTQVPKDVHCFYLGRDLSTQESKKIGDLFNRKEKVTIILKLPSKEHSSPDIISDRTFSLHENSSINSNKSNNFNTIFNNYKNDINRKNNLLASMSFSPKQSIQKLKLINSMGLINQNKNTNKKIKILNCKNSHFLKKSINSIFKRNMGYGLPFLFNSNTYNTSINFTSDNINNGHYNTKQNGEFPLCNCKKFKISFYCRNCKNFICSQCRESQEHKDHLTILLNSNNLEESIKIYLMIVLTDIHKKSIYKNYNNDIQELSLEYFNRREEDINNKFIRLNNIYKYYLNHIKEKIKDQREERIKILINAYEKGSMKIGKELYEINERIKNNYIKKNKHMKLEQLEQYFDDLNNKEKILNVLSRDINQFYLIYEIKNKLNNTLYKIENTLDEINNKPNPFNLKNEYKEELLKILEK